MCKLKYIYISFQILIIIPLFISGRHVSIKPIKQYKVKTLYIDQGHGGRDGGCKGYNNCIESELTYKIGIKLGDRVKSEYKNIQIVFTRNKNNKNAFIGLAERVKKIRNAKPEIVISLHCNSCRDRNVKGFEVYIMGPKAKWPSLGIIADLKSHNERVISREHSVITLERNWQKKYAKLDKESILHGILVKNRANMYYKNSLLLAHLIDKNIKLSGIKSRGIHEGPYILLWKSYGISVLVELGYITNPEEAKFLCSEDGQRQVVNRLFHGIDQCIRILEGR